MAYVPLKEFASIASAHFRNKLSLETMLAYRNISTIMKDPRISYMLLNLSNHNSIDFNLYEPKAPSDADKVSLKDLDYHARLSFPPCMKSLYSAL